MILVLKSTQMPATAQQTKLRKCCFHEELGACAVAGDVAGERRCQRRHYFARIFAPFRLAQRQRGYTSAVSSLWATGTAPFMEAWDAW